MDYKLFPGRSLKKLNYVGNDVLVSIITPCYASDNLIDTAYSVLNQSFPYFEWIVVNDGSTNKKTLEDLKKIKSLDKRIKVFNKENEGVSKARDYGASKASNSSKYYVFLDDDDLIDNTYIEMLYYTLELHQEASWAYTDVCAFGAKEYLWKKHYDSDRMKTENLLVVTGMIRKEAFNDVNGFEIYERKVYEDWNLWLKLIAKGYYPIHVSTNSFWYRIKDNGELSKSKVNDEHAMEIINKTVKTITKKTEVIEYPRENYNWELIERNKVIVPKYKNESKINILFIIPWMVMGGADKFNLDLITSLDKKKYSVTIVTTQQTEYKWRQKFEEVCDTVFELPSFLDRKDWPAFVEYIIKSRGINIIFNTNSVAGYEMLPYLKCLFPDIPILDYIHMEEWYNRNGGYSRDSQGVSSVIDKTYFCNKNSENIIVNHFGVDKNKVGTIYIGVDTEVFDPSKYNKKELMKKYDIPEGVKVINFIARIAYQKRPFLFMRIVEEYVKKDKNVLFVVAGDGELLDNIKTIAREKNLLDNIKFLGKIDTPSEIYIISDLSLNCSIKEGLALTSYESLSLGIPIVSCDVGGQKELITKDVGVIVPCLQDESEVYDTNYSDEEIQNYIDGIEKVFKDLNKYKSNCRKHILKNFDVKKMYSEFDKVFEKYSKEKTKIRFDNIDIAKELYVQYLEGTTGLYKYYAIGYNHSVYGDLNYHQSKKRILLNNIENTATKIHLKSEYGIFKKFVKDFILLIKCIYNLTIGFVFNIIKNIVKKTIKLFKLIK